MKKMNLTVMLMTFLLTVAVLTGCGGRQVSADRNPTASASASESASGDGSVTGEESGSSAEPSEVHEETGSGADSSEGNGEERQSVEENEQGSDPDGDAEEKDGADGENEEQDAGDSSGTDDRFLSRRERLAKRRAEALARQKEKEETNSGNSSESTDGGAGESREEKDPTSLKAVASVGGLEATVEQEQSACVVFIFDEEKNHGNPYGVTWDYGPEYEAYLEMADWSLVFDADWYALRFPMLAYQYHNNRELLLRHFQTVGIHEGRQGNASFNVAAYMANCSGALREAFGENYECYYLWYMLHQDTESGVVTTGNYSGQLTMKLTAVQKEEIRWINWYREEENVRTCEFDAELAAMADYRAYMDCTEGWDAHDGLEHMTETGEMDRLFDMLHADVYCENKNTIGGSRETIGTGDHLAAYGSYRSSQGHYETMIDPEYGYVGCGNLFVSDRDYNWAGKYEVNLITLDTYADTVSNPFHNPG